MMASQDQIDLKHLRSWMGREASVCDIATPGLLAQISLNLWSVAAAAVAPP
jgi:hypothetical protein